MITQMRISATNLYISCNEEGLVEGAIVNVRELENDYFPFEFQHPSRPGSWLVVRSHELEPLEEPIEALADHYADVIAQKDAALKIAAFVFNQYATNHFGKETPEGILKALTNVGLERMMLDALEVD